MRRSSWLAATSVFVLTACAACRQTPAPPASTAAARAPAPATEDAARRVTALADEYLRGYVETYPDLAAAQGLAAVPNDRFSDNSRAALTAWQAREDRWAAELSRIDGRALWGRREWVTYGLLRETVDDARLMRVCRPDLWPANQMSGWQVGLVQLADIQPVGTEERRRQALARWRQVPRYVDTEIANLREGLRLGYSTPKHNVELVVAQLDALLATPTGQSPFFGPARRDGSPAFVQEWTAFLDAELAPAIRRYRDYLRGPYLAEARSAIAITANTNGARCYEAMMRANTTLDRPPAETLRLGEDEVARSEAEMVELARAQFGTATAAAVRQRVTSDPANRFSSRDEVLAFAKEAIERARAAMPSLVSKVPRADVVLVPHAAFAEATASDQYEAPADDGSRPGTYRIKLYKPEELKRSRSEITVYHETYPGHHFQIATANEGGGIHPMARLAPTMSYVEGWARYAEALSEQAGLYTSTYAKVGRRMWPGHGMVVDPGIHAFGWRRERAVAYVVSSGYFTQTAAEAFVDRVVVWPGQATSYDTGALEIRALRRQAEQALGTSFDVRQFHSVVLDSGAVTLPMLRQLVERWVAQQRAAPQRSGR